MIKRTTKSADASILEELVAPDEASYSVALAKALLMVAFRPQQRREIERLLNRNNEGTLTARQKNRLEAYVRVGNFLSLLKAKARTSLTASSRR